MWVVLDTNILRQDFSLSGNECSILLDFLKKSRSKLLLPNVVLDELKVLYVEHLRNKKQAAEAALDALFRHVPSKKPPEVDIDPDSEGDKYTTFLTSRLGLSHQSTIQYGKDWLDTIVSRVVQGVPPANRNKKSEKSEGFKDTLVWLSILDWAKENPTQEIGFITNDEHFQDSAGGLNPRLRSEVEETGCNLKFYSSLSAFNIEQATPIKEYDRNRVVQLIEEQDVGSKVYDFVRSDEKGLLRDWLYIRDPHFIHEKVFGSLPENLVDYYAYKMEDNSIRIECVISMEFFIRYSTSDGVTSSLPIGAVSNAPGIGGDSRSTRFFAVARYFFLIEGESVRNQGVEDWYISLQPVILTGDRDSVWRYWP